MSLEMDIQAMETSSGQGGVISRDQALDLGFSRRQIQRRVTDGLWSPIGRLGYQVTAGREDESSRLHAAVALLPSAVVSHQSAARIHGWEVFTKGPITVTVHTRTTHEFPGVLVRRAHDIQASHITKVGALPTTNVARTCIDLAAVVSPGWFADAVDDLVATDRVDLEVLAAVAADVCRRGRPGSSMIKAYLAQRLVSPPSGSALERRGRALLETAGLPRPTSEFAMPWAPRRRFDDAYPDHMVAIEWDSRRYHMRMDAFEADRRRDRMATIQGWKVLRFTWKDVTETPEVVVAAVSSLLLGNDRVG